MTLAHFDREAHQEAFAQIEKELEQPLLELVDACAPRAREYLFKLDLRPYQLLLERARVIPADKKREIARLAAARALDFETRINLVLIDVVLDYARCYLWLTRIQNLPIPQNWSAHLLEMAPSCLAEDCLKEWLIEAFDEGDIDYFKAMKLALYLGVKLTSAEGKQLFTRELGLRAEVIFLHHPDPSFWNDQPMVG